MTITTRRGVFEVERIGKLCTIVRNVRNGIRIIGTYEDVYRFIQPKPGYFL